MLPILKKFGIVGLGALAACQSGPRPALTPAQLEYTASYRQLSDETQKQRPICAAWIRKTNRLAFDAEKLSGGALVLPQRQELQALVDGFPVPSPAARELIRRYLGSSPDPDPRVRTEVVTSLVSAFRCDPFAYYGAVSSLIKSLQVSPDDPIAKAPALSPKPIIASVLRQARADLASPGPLAPLLVYDALLKDFAGHGWIAASSRLQNQLRRLDEAADEARLAMQARPEPVRPAAPNASEERQQAFNWSFDDHLRRELRRAEALRKQTQEFLDALGAVG